jgi:small-conductance mechanosensitive channel
MKDLLTFDFLSKILSNASNWIIQEFPGLIILVFILFVLLRTFNYSFNRLKKTMIKRAELNETVDTGEAIKRINTLTGIVHATVKIIIMTVFVIMILPKFKINIAPILASAGILGLAIGFGAQELVRDYISGFFIILENQLRAGDVGIINGTGGLVEKIELRTITLRDFSGVVHVIQNGKINTLANMTKDWSAMVFDIGVAYKENVDQVIEIMKQVGEELQNDEQFGPNIIEPIEVFGLDKFADSALVIKARLKTKPITQWTTGREYRRRLKIAFDKQNIEIPFPHQTIYWGEEINPLKLQLKQEDQN